MFVVFVIPPRVAEPDGNRAEEGAERTKPFEAANDLVMSDSMRKCCELGRDESRHDCESTDLQRGEITEELVCDKCAHEKNYGRVDEKPSPSGLCEPLEADFALVANPCVFLSYRRRKFCYRCEESIEACLIVPSGLIGVFMPGLFCLHETLPP